MVKGYAGSILRVNLSTKSITTEPIDPNKARKFIGGAGYGAEILYSELKPGIDSLGPDNKLVFATSPISCNSVPGGGSIMVCFKSPLTKAWGESRCGGNFGPDLRKAGFDILIIEGTSETPVYLAVNKNRAKLRDGFDLVGKDVYEKTDWVEEAEMIDGKKPSVMSIGQAGEKEVRFASIMYRDRAAGRNGGGAVMGSKNLMAISVFGDSRPETANPQNFKTLTKNAMKTVRSSEMRDGFNECGTIGDMPANDEDGDWPSQNWRSNSWGEGPRLFDEFQEEHLIRANRCYDGCPIGCGRICEVKEGPYKTPEHEGGEYESISVFTAFLLNRNLDAAVHCDYLCNRWGLDTISTGALIAFAMECFENGVLTKDDTDGLDLTWGNSEALPAIVRLIAFRQGIGDILAEGVKRAADKFGKGSEKYAVHIKGLEGPAHDARSGKILGIAYGTANRGMCHIHPLEGMAYDRGKMHWGMVKHGVRDPEQMDRWEETGKGKDCAMLQQALILPDVLCTCKFMSYAGLDPEHWAEMLAQSTGWDLDAEELLQVGERVLNIQRLFNAREGLRRQDDLLPDRVRAIPEFGTYKGEDKCVIQDFDALLDEYYEACGWDQITGIPRLAKLKELGLEAYAGWMR